jgi:terminase small subunit / prophage DNA-packing protein
MAGMQLTKGDLARFFDVALPTVTSWVRKGCPYVEKGSKSKAWIFDTAAVAGWREEQAAQNAVGDTASLDIEEARRRKLAAEAAMVELDLAKRRGEVIEIEEVAGVVGDDYANVRAKLLSLPTKLAPQLIGIEDPAECKALIERGVSEALEELTADGIYSGESPGIEDQGPEEGESQAAA